MVKENISGQMDLVMKVLSLKEADKVKEIGNQQKQVEISTLVLMKETKRVAMAGMYGSTAAPMKVTF